LPVLAAGYQKAVDTALAAKAQNPANPDEKMEARFGLGSIQARLGQKDQAIKNFERAVVLNCDSFDNLQMLGKLYRETGAAEKSLNMYQAALAVAECDPKAAYAITCATLGQSISSDATNPCQALTQRTDLTQTLADVRTAISQLKTQLGR
jgi:tetratricopeptide (TPR) repeat protein